MGYHKRSKKPKSSPKSVHKTSKHKYDIKKEIEKTKTAYADSIVTKKDMSPEEEKKWLTQVLKKRNLSWSGTKYLSPSDFFKVAKIVGGYNLFKPKKVFAILRRYPNAGVKLGREGSVVTYIDPNGHSKKQIMDDMRVLGDADEIDVVKRGWKMSK
jgi:hypothetical protein